MVSELILTLLNIKKKKKLFKDKIIYIFLLKWYFKIPSIFIWRHCEVSLKKTLMKSIAHT